MSYFHQQVKQQKVLSENTGEQASTIHRGLGYMPPDKWGYNETEKYVM